MINYFRPYDGTKPYIFVSYAHKDSEKVLDIINGLRNQKYLIWYDEGIPAGSDWPQNISDHMRDCDSVLMFLSSSFYASKNCLMEQESAMSQGKTIYTFNLDDSTSVMPLLSEKLIGTDDDYNQKRKIKRKFNWWIIGLVAALGLAVGSFAAVNKITEGKTLAEIRSQQTSTVDVIFSDDVDTSSLGSVLTKNVDFKDNVTDSLVRFYLNKGEGDIPTSELLNLSEFMVCGNLRVDNIDDLSFNSAGDSYFKGMKILRGPIADLSVQGDMLYLKKLVLSNQNITDLSDISALANLEYLDVSNNDIEDISCLDAMNNLVDLHIEHTKVTSVDSLKYLRNLTNVYVSADMLPIKNSTDICIRVVW